MTTPDIPSANGSSDVLHGYAREMVRRDILMNLGRLSAGYFTSIGLSAAEVDDSLTDPVLSLDSDDRLTDEDVFQLLANVSSHISEDDREDQLAELANRADTSDLSSYERLRIDAATVALTDYYDVKSLMARGLSKHEAITELSTSRSSEVEGYVTAWQVFYTAAKGRGHPVPPTIEAFAEAYLDRFSNTENA